MTVRQLSLLEDDPRMRSAGRGRTPPFKLQLLKWVGNKQRFAHEIIDYFPEKFGTYYEPFLGSGAVLGTLMPAHGIASDILQPLMDIWRALASDPGYAQPVVLREVAAIHGRRPPRCLREDQG